MSGQPDASLEQPANDARPAAVHAMTGFPGPDFQ